MVYADDFTRLELAKRQLTKNATNDLAFLLGVDGRPVYCIC